MPLEDMPAKLHRARLLAREMAARGTDVEPLYRTMVRVRHYLAAEQVREAERLLDAVLARWRGGADIRRDSAA